uniref:Bidirectional sugar transporter SWEET n=1 Tax=Grammatophora oceanica TaxID=210454 RepID=A0A7S1Y776_9STRA|mmetsp:Transcript_27378/g.40105  ORF Transcript_27378/g.40105 Transcript_27378/m.40105 type:complete len:289 (+) Transcript_27378:189-1055(+)|eukprot:CAMPEP_0194030098 /NCGR_PEP_ID=MMETSP0009_2-20130614/3693_1 /TAXON_ID=210454 /ORGANISM="Grammatophora oceanica, Strain CCMP 410" /LENGTH=288 /DNA_ID=CAMNT_0038669979 /DNA_START=137 /DNA_END=1003 /DNA_ORIENTATION=-
MSWIDIFLDYVCPSVGGLMSGLMFAAPVFDLRMALQKGSLGCLDPLPWVFMTGNCLGWNAYAYYTSDPFILSANLPGLLLSIWLNSGAAKLQYLARWEEAKEREAEQREGDESVHSDATSQMERNELLVAVPQERYLLRMLIGWSIVLVYVGWLGRQAASPGNIVGFIVNINLIFFYGAPLNTIKQVIRDGKSDAIHRPTMFMNWINTSFWVLYGLARRDPVIYVPNATGLALGITQGVLCLYYPSRSNSLANMSHDENDLFLSPDDDGTNSYGSDEAPASHSSNLVL